MITPTCPTCHKNTEVRSGAWVGRWVCACGASFGSEPNEFHPLFPGAECTVSATSETSGTVGEAELDDPAAKTGKHSSSCDSPSVTSRPSNHATEPTLEATAKLVAERIRWAVQNGADDWWLDSAMRLEAALSTRNSGICDAEFAERLELERSAARAELDTAHFNLSLSQSQHAECAKELATHRAELAPLRLKAADRDEWQDVAIKVSKERDKLLGDLDGLKADFKQAEESRVVNASLERAFEDAVKKERDKLKEDEFHDKLGITLLDDERWKKWDALIAAVDDLERLTAERDTMRETAHNNSVYLDPSCHKGCQSLKHRNDLDASQQTVAVLRAVLGIVVRRWADSTAAASAFHEHTVAQLQEELERVQLRSVPPPQP